MIKTEIKEVSLYRSGCFVKRQGKVTVGKEKQHVELTCGSSTIDPSTVRMGLPEGVTGTNVQVEKLSADTRRQQTRQLEEKIARLNNQIEAKKTQQSMWTANADFSNKESLNVNEMAEYIDKLPQRLDSIYSEIEELNAQLTDLNKQLQEKNKEVNCYLVSVDLEAEKEGEYPVEVRYFDTNAGWNPIYEIHTSDDSDTLSVRLKGSIRQNTTENWKQAKLTLFSGNPSISGTIPVLNPSRINFFEPARAPRTSGRNLYKSAARVAEDTDMMVEEEAAPMMMAMGAAMAPVMNDVVTATAAVKQNDTMMEYELPGLWDVRNDNDAKVDISTETIDCKYHIIAIPKLDDAGYLAAEVKTTDIESLMQTNAMVYHQGAYLGEVFLDPDMTKDTYNVSLGRDESIRLKRTQKKRYTSNVLLKGQKKTEFEYELRIASTKNKACKVTVSDQIPVSQDKTIVVEHTNISGGKLTEDTGLIEWEFDLEPAGTKTLALEYTVAWPKDKQINY
ncbi:MAG: mucoidy inhibitor MuiA family protein [Erysipelotrichaceae bacterium]|nr:mucoidy inhibitor MuiA family protein [Erysipelotrichaceae bacterium]